MDHLNWMMFSGAAGLGLVVGALVAFFVDEAEEMSHRVLHSADGVISGGVVVGLIHTLNGHGITEVTEEYWGYGVGLAVGFLFGLLFNWLTLWKPKRKA